MNLNANFDPFALDERAPRKNGGEVVAMLHELYAAYPQEKHEILAQALLQARKNLDPGESYEAIEKEVARLLGLLAVLKLRAENEHARA